MPRITGRHNEIYGMVEVNQYKNSDLHATLIESILYKLCLWLINGIIEH